MPTTFSNRSNGNVIQASWFNDLQDAVITLLTDPVNILDHGALGDDATDNRALFQAAIDAVAASGGGRILVPPGVYQFTQAGTNTWCLQLKTGVTLIGAGVNTVLKLAADAGDSVRLIANASSATDIGLLDLVIDGNKNNNSTDEQRAGMFLADVTRAQFERVTFQNCTGDGAALYESCVDVSFQHCQFLDNERDGVSFLGASTNHVQILDSLFSGNAFEPIDSEPTNGSVTNVLIRGNRVIATDGVDYAITTGGNSNESRNQNWVITGNKIWNAGIDVIHCEHLTISDNLIDVSSATTATTAIRGRYDSRDVLVQGNQVVGGGATALVLFETTGTDFAQRVSIVNNHVTATSGQAIRINGSKHVLISGNVCDLTGGTHDGIYSQITAAMDTLTIANNVVIMPSTGAVAGIGISPYSTNVIEQLSIVGNTVYGGTSYGIRLTTPSTGYGQVTVANNLTDNGVTVKVAIPSGLFVSIAGQQFGPGMFMGDATPESALSAPIGSLCVNTSGGDATTLYVKESGTGSTGWVAK